MKEDVNFESNLSSKNEATFIVYCSTVYLMGNGKNPVEEELAFSKLMEREFPQITFEDGKQERIVFAPPIYIHPRSGIARMMGVPKSSTVRHTIFFWSSINDVTAVGGGGQGFCDDCTQTTIAVVSNLFWFVATLLSIEDVWRYPLLVPSWFNRYEDREEL